MEHLGDQLLVLRRKDLHRALEAVTCGQRADQVELVSQRAHGKRAQRGGIGQRMFEMLGHLGGVEDQRKEFLEVLGLHLAGEEPLDERPQRARGIVDDVAELFVFAVDVADDVYGPLGEREDGREPRDLGHGGIDVGELAGQGAEERELVAGGVDVEGGVAVHGE